MISNLFQKYIANKKWMFRWLLIVFVLSLVPLLYIAQYNHPSADDFNNGNNTVHIWRATGSISQMIPAAIASTRVIYETMGGNFVTSFLLQLQPGVFSQHLYMLSAMVLLLGFVASTMFLLKVILIDYLRADKYSYGIIAIVVTFISVQFLDSPVEAFFWYTGGMVYTGSHSVSLVMFSLTLLSFKNDNPKLKVIYYLIVPILAFLIGGGNYITAPTSAVVMALILAYRVAFKRGKWLVPLLGLLALCAALTISIMAPGNALRQEFFESMNPILAIITSFGYGVLFIRLIIEDPIWFAFGCIVPLIYRVAKNSTFSFRLPGLVTALLYCVYASTFAPNLYAQSTFGPARAMNLNYYAFILFLFSVIIYWSGWISRKRNTAKSTDNEQRECKNEAEKSRSLETTVIGLLMTGFAIGCVTMLYFNTNTITSVSATISLVNGSARAYHIENLERIELLSDPELTHLELPPFTAPPHVLFFDDITENPYDWRNFGVALFYGKESVVLKCIGDP